MTDNFDLRKYLVENKVTTNSRMLNENESNPSPEEAAKIATKLAPKLENDPKIQKVADAIASDPKAKAELMKLIGMNENVDTNLVKNLATKFAEKASHMQINEEGGFDFGGAFWSGLLGGGTLAYKLAAMGDVITPHMKMMGHSPSHMGAVVLGAIGGAILACVGKAVYDKSKGANESKKSTNSRMLNEEVETYNVGDYGGRYNDLEEKFLFPAMLDAGEWMVSQGIDPELADEIENDGLEGAWQVVEDETGKNYPLICTFKVEDMWVDEEKAYDLGDGNVAIVEDYTNTLMVVPKAAFEKFKQAVTSQNESMHSKQSKHKPVKKSDSKI